MEKNLSPVRLQKWENIIRTFFRNYDQVKLFAQMRLTRGKSCHQISSEAFELDFASETVCLILSCWHFLHPHLLPKNCINFWKTFTRNENRLWKPWLWRSWQSGCFRPQRSADWIPTSATFFKFNCQLLVEKTKISEKEAGNGPFLNKKERCSVLPKRQKLKYALRSFKD